MGPQEIPFRHFGDTGATRGDNIPKSNCKGFKNVQKHFLVKFLYA